MTNDPHFRSREPITLRRGSQGTEIMRTPELSSITIAAMQHGSLVAEGLQFVLEIRPSSPDYKPVRYVVEDAEMHGATLLLRRLDDE